MVYVLVKHGFLLNGLKNLYYGFMVLAIGLIVVSIIQFIIVAFKIMPPRVYEAYTDVADIARRLVAVLMLIYAPAVLVVIVSLYFKYNGFRLLKEYSKAYRLGFIGSVVAGMSVACMILVIALTPVAFTAKETLGVDPLAFLHGIKTAFTIAFIILIIGLCNCF